MKAGEKLSLGQIQAFLEGSEEVRFEAKCQAGLYEWVSRTLQEHGYHRLSKKGKGLVKRYISKMTGLSRAQVTRLISQYDETGEVKVKRQQRRRFAPRYTRADIELLDQRRRLVASLIQRIGPGVARWRRERNWARARGPSSKYLQKRVLQATENIETDRQFLGRISRPLRLRLWVGR